MKKDTKLTLADLIAKKAAKQASKDRTEEVYINSLGGEIDIKRPKNSFLYKTIDMLKDESFEDVIYANSYLIYHSVSAFQDKSLHEAYEVKEPVEIVQELLEISEINEVATKILELAGFSKPEDLKNEVKN
ncbi:phage tail assembly chaperone [Marinicrinis sediminis]|uniref:Phage portal protein n=1 Tax=Marinicrinis sediminis TaxID=1652465 RepID=A0ABW5RA23_9BACL